MMSATMTTTSDLASQIRAAVLDQLQRLRFDRAGIETTLDSGGDPRIPSRKALVVIARVAKNFGLSKKIIKKSDLLPEQVTSVRNLTDLLTRRIREALEPS